MAMKKELLYRLPGYIVAHLEMHSADEILKEHGLDPGGDVQIFHTQNVLRRIIKYMPTVSGMTIKATIAKTNVRKPVILTDTPYAKYLFIGKVMVNEKTGKGPAVIPGIGPRFPVGSTLVATERDLTYDRSKNAKAGPRWDLRLFAAEGKAIAEDLQRYINMRGG